MIVSIVLARRLVEVAHRSGDQESSGHEACLRTAFAYRSGDPVPSRRPTEGPHIDDSRPDRQLQPEYRIGVRRGSSACSSSTTGPRCEFVKCVEHLPGLPHSVPGETGELLEDVHLRKRRDSAKCVLRGDAEFTCHSRCVDDRLAEQDIG